MAEPIPDPPPPDTLPYFDDDFARGDGCAKAPLTSTGFGWGATHDGGGPPPDSARVVANAAAPSGCALALIYQADVPGGDGWIEPRFKIGTVHGQHVKEIFVGMVIKTPTNYVHRNDTGPDNNKLLRLWDLSYQGSMVHHGMSTRPHTTLAGRSRMLVEFPMGGSTENHGTGPSNLVFVPGSVDTIGFYTKVASGIGVPDGIIRIWWNRQLVYDRTNLPLTKATTRPGAFNGFGNGYLLGWANSGFTYRTEFHLWRFVLAPAPLPWFLPPFR